MGENNDMYVMGRMEKLEGFFVIEILNTSLYLVDAENPGPRY